MTTTGTATTKYGDQLTLTYRTGDCNGDHGHYHIAEAHHDGEMVGELYWDFQTGQIMWVHVDADRQGEGIARALYEYAEGIFDIYHSPDEHCTPEGLAFKDAMGGETIPAHLAYQPK